MDKSEKLKRCWKFGTRWSDNGRPDSCIIDTVFIPNKIAFAYTDAPKQICEGDLIVFADGYRIIAIGKATTPGVCLQQLDRDSFERSECLEFMEDEEIHGCRAKIISLNEDDTFDFKKQGRFYQIQDIDVRRRVNSLWTAYTQQEQIENQALLFDFANKELAQDSFICWLFANADNWKPGDTSPLRDMGYRFIQAILAKIGKTLDFSSAENSFLKVDVYKQYAHIDAVVKIACGDQKITLVIEDKVAGPVYNDIQGYLESVRENKNFGDSDIFPVIIRTGDDSGVKQDTVIPYFLREDFLNFFEANLEKCRKSDILFDFYNHIKKIDNNQNSFRTLPIKSWTDSSWKGFYSEIKRKNTEGRATGLHDWEYVPNQNGGFFAMLGEYVYIQEHPVYWQIESDKKALCLKLGEIYEKHSSVRDSFIALIEEYIRHNPEFADLGMTPPNRKGCGCYMTLKRINAEAWLGKDEEMPDMEKIIAKLEQCNEFLHKFETERS